MENCSCVFTDPDGCVELLESLTPIARKIHKCQECYREILPGEKYLLEKFVWDGEIDRHKTCCDCWSIRNTFFCNGWIYGQLLEDLANYICDCAGKISSDKITSITLLAREIIVDMIQKTWDGEANE